MSEICHNCPIVSNDPDTAVLNTVAAGMVNAGKPTGNGWIQEAYNLFDSYDAVDQETAELLFEARDYPPEKLDTARKCAQQILWNECDFNNLD